MTQYSTRWFKSRQHFAADSSREIVPFLNELIRPTSVVDVGCGLGAWLVEWQKAGVKRVLGIDGPYVSKSEVLVEERNFRHHDLSQPLRLQEAYDLAMCLEVAEHIPEDHAESLIDTLSNLAPTIAFSAAIPSQGGNFHVNEQWPEYWAQKFEDRGYLLIDAIRRHLWRNGNVAFWYAQNAMIFAKPEVLETNAALRSAYENTDSRQLAIVHPALYMRTAATLERTFDYRLRQRIKRFGRLVRSFMFTKGSN